MKVHHIKGPIIGQEPYGEIRWAGVNFPWIFNRVPLFFGGYVGKPVSVKLMRRQEQKWNPLWLDRSDGDGNYAQELINAPPILYQ